MMLQNLETGLALAVGGFVIGLLIGLTGVGAGSLTTPLLISGFGIPPAVAVGTDLLFACLTKVNSAWSHWRLGHVDWTIVKRLMAGSLPGALAVLAWLHLAQPDTRLLANCIRYGLAVALVTSSIAMFAFPWIMKRRAEHKPLLDQAIAPGLSTVVLGLVVGSLVALTSVGAGAIGVIALISLYPALQIRRTIGTDIAHAIPLTLLSGVAHASRGSVDVYVLAALLAGSLPGVALGSRATGYLPEWALRAILCSILLLAALMVLPK